GAKEFSVPGINHQEILLAVADPDIAIAWIHRNAMRHAELALAHAVAEPLVHELAGTVQMDDPRGADIVGGTARVRIVGAFVGMTLGDIDVPFTREGDHHGLPQQPLTLGFVPIAALPLGPYGFEAFAVR